MQTGNKIVNDTANVLLMGNIIPNEWYRSITFDSGKPYLIAIVILADIVYWYRPREVRDEISGRTIKWEKKFASDLLQRSYDHLADQFGISKREATNAIVHLEKMGIIKRHLRTITVQDIKCSNVLFIELIPSKLRDITGQSGSYPCEK